MRVKTAAGAGARALVRKALERLPVERTPHSWSDAAGTYFAENDAWLYQELPLTMLRQGDGGRTPLDELLRQLAIQRPRREVHLLLHAWEERAEPAAETPGPLRIHLEQAMTFFVPTRRLLVGVRLDASGGDSSRVRRVGEGLAAGVDDLLGELVPSFETWTLDRDRVGVILAAAGGVTASAASRRHLESWYTLGAPVDVDLDEHDDAIAVDGRNVIELVAVASLSSGAASAATALMSAGRRGASVASVRGMAHLGKDDMDGRDPASGTLSRTSIVLGRRAEDAGTPWAVTLRRLSGLEQRPLPMRQLLALNETLPCSTKRVSPVLNRVSVAALGNAGFTDTLTVGDDGGTFVGLASPDFAYPFYLNPSMPGPVVTALTGSAGAGKSFTLEWLAAQCSLAGQRVVRVGGRSRLAAAGTQVQVWATDGDLSPFRFMPPAEAAQVAEAACNALVHLSDSEAEQLAAGFRRAAAVGNPTFAGVFALADGVAGTARVGKALLAQAGVRLALSDPDIPVELAVDTLIQVPALADEQVPASVRSTLADLLVANVLRYVAAAPWPGGTLVVLDDVEPSVLGGRQTANALDALAGSGVHVLLATSATAQLAASPIRAHIGRVLAHAETDPDAAAAALTLAGLDVTPERVEWLAEAHAHVADGVVSRPALAAHRDLAGRTASVLIGPVPPESLTELTDGQASGYVLG